LHCTFGEKKSEARFRKYALPRMLRAVALFLPPLHAPEGIRRIIDDKIGTGNKISHQVVKNPLPVISKLTLQISLS